MIVQDVMQPHVVTGHPDTSLKEALRLMRQRGIRHLPIVDAGLLVGIVSDRDVGQAVAAGEVREEAGAGDILARIPIGAIMTRQVITTGPMTAVEEAAAIMLGHRISAVPVLDAERLVGIVTETDLLRVLVRALGAGQPSSRLDVLLEPSGASVGEVIALVEAAGVPVSSVLTMAGDTMREIILRVPTIDPGPAVRALAAKGYAVRAWNAPA